MRIENSSRQSEAGDRGKAKKTKAGMACALSGFLLVAGLMGCAARSGHDIPIVPATRLSRAVEMPSQMKGGQGTAEDRFKARLELGREDSGIGSVSLDFPLTVRVGGVAVCYQVNLSLSQLRESRREDVAAELLMVIRSGAEAYAARRGIDLGGRVDADAKGALELFSRQAAIIDVEVKMYLEGARAEKSGQGQGE